MGIFDRFSSQKGKADKAAPAPAATKSAKAAAAKKEAFKAVPGDQPKAKEKEAPKAAAAAPANAKKATGDAHRVLLSAVVTEKSTRHEKNGKYIFMVGSTATKKTVAAAVKEVYGVQPIAINMTSLPGKMVRYGRTTGRQIGRKKAIVSLPAGKSIDIVST